MLFAGGCFRLFRSLARRFRQIAVRGRRRGVQIAEDPLDLRRECQLGVQLGPIQLASGNLVLTQDGKRRLHPALVSIKKPQAMAALRRRGKINDDGALIRKSGENLYPSSAPNPPKPTLAPLATKPFTALNRCCPPTACRYLSMIWSADGWSLGIRISSCSSRKAPYMSARVGVVSGRSRPRWQLQQVTFWSPKKLSWLMACTIFTILRAVTFRSVSLAQSTFWVPAPSWQSAQSKPSDAHIIPIVPRKSSTETPFNTWTFLKTWSAVGFFSCGAADPIPTGQVIAMITRAALAAPATMSLTPRSAALPVVSLIA